MFVAVLLASLAVHGDLARAKGFQEPDLANQGASSRKTSAERIDDLIRRTNALESFSATYHLRKRDGREGELVFLFRAPDRAKVTFSGEDMSVVACLTGDICDFRMHEPDKVPVAWTVEGADAAVRRLDELRDLLSASFPEGFRSDDLPGGGGIRFNLSSGQSESKDDTEFQWEIAIVPGLFSRLSWLDRLRDLTPIETGSSEDLVYSDDGEHRWTLSGESGFIVKIERKTKDGYETGLRLEKLELDPKLEDSEFRVPVREPGVQDVSDRVRSGLLASALGYERWSLYRVIATMVEDRRLEWDGASRDKADELFREVHARSLRSILGPWVESENAWIDQMVDWLRSSLERIDRDDREGRDQLEGKVAEQRKSLESILAKAREDYRTRAIPPPVEKVKSEVYGELFPLEKEAFQRVFDENIEKPLLDAFDEKVGTLLKE